MQKRQGRSFRQQRWKRRKRKRRRNPTRPPRLPREWHTMHTACLWVYKKSIPLARYQRMQNRTSFSHLLLSRSWPLLTTVFPSSTRLLPKGRRTGQQSKKVSGCILILPAILTRLLPPPPPRRRRCRRGVCKTNTAARIVKRGRTTRHGNLPWARPSRMASRGTVLGAPVAGR